MTTNRPIKDFRNVMVRVEGVNAIMFFEESALECGIDVPVPHFFVKNARALRDWLNEQFPREGDPK